MKNSEKKRRLARKEQSWQKEAGLPAECREI